MMLWPAPVPLSVDYEYERPPWATLGLVATNVLVWMWASGASVDAVLGLVLQTDAFALHQVFTSCFLHLGFLHLLVNMIGLVVFGRYVEARVGRRNVVLLYLACGLGGSLAFLLEWAAMFDEPRAVLGASGAISGLIGFTLVAAPRAEIRVFLWWFGHREGGAIPTFPAWFALGAWILWQLLLYVAAGRYLATAFSAHFGGLLAGAALSFLMHAKLTEGTSFHLERAPSGGSMDEERRKRVAEKWRKIGEERRAKRRARKAARDAARAQRRAHADHAPVDLPPVPPVPPAPPATDAASSGNPPPQRTPDEDPFELPPASPPPPREQQEWGSYDDAPPPRHDDEPIDLPPAPPEPAEPEET
jgi:membrane associated rhomboid family serine protease